jgi:hypothetical protein
MKKITNYVYKNWKWVVLVGLLLITIFSRFYKLPERVLWWDGDAAGDMTMAYHMVHFGEKIWIGKGTMGGKGILVDSYLYYYFLALAWLVGTSPVGVGVIMAVMSVLTAMMIYFIGRQLTNSTYALILATMVTFNWYFNYVSLLYFAFICQVLLLVLAIWLFVKSWEKRSAAIWVIYFLVLMTTLHFDYSILSIFPILVGWGIINYFRVVKNKSNKVKYLLAIWPLVLLGVWLVTSGSSNYLSWAKMISFAGGKQLTLTEWLKNLGEILSVSANYFLRIKSLFLSGIFFVFVYGALIYLVFKDCRERKINWWKSVFLLSLILGILGVGVMGGKESVYHFYTFLYYPLWLVAMVYVGWRFSKFHRKIGLYLWALVLVLILVLETNIFENNNQGVLLSDISGGLEESELVAEQILMDSKSNSITNFKVVFYNRDTQLDNFGKEIFWYPLEKILNRKMLKIIQSPPDISYLGEINQSKTIYLVCFSFKYSKWQDFSRCDQIFLEKHEESKYLEAKVINEINGELSYSIYRFTEL